MIRRCIRLTGLTLLGCTVAVTSAAAQEARGNRGVQGGPRVVTIDTVERPVQPGELQNANQVRYMIQALLREYPPFLAEVLRLDPSLLSNEPFMQAYPNLSAFLNQHPEIIRSPSFFLGDPNQNYRRENYNGPGDLWDEILAGIAAFSAFIVVVSLLTWVIKTVIDHRRWLRVSKIQSEVHSKLLDRFTSNQDLLAYIETPAGRRFLESAPILIDGPRALSAPVSRILFSVQIGIVLALAGIGLQYVSRDIVTEVAQPLFVLGILSLAVGTGFVLSALIAYVLSQRLGLLNQTTAGSTTDSPGVSPPHA